MFSASRSNEIAREWLLKHKTAVISSWYVVQHSTAHGYSSPSPCLASPQLASPHARRPLQVVARFPTTSCRSPRARRFPRFGERKLNGSPCKNRAQPAPPPSTAPWVPRGLGIRGSLVTTAAADPSAVAPRQGATEIAIQRRQPPRQRPARSEASRWYVRRLGSVRRGAAVAIRSERAREWSNEQPRRDAQSQWDLRQVTISISFGSNRCAY